MVLGASLGPCVTLVYLAMSAKIGDDGKVAAATFDLALEGCCGYKTESAKCRNIELAATGGCVFWVLTLFARVAVHVRLERTWSREALVADLALVLLL